MNDLEKKLKRGLSILNKGLEFNYLDKEVSDLFHDRFVFQVNSNNPKAQIQKSWINSIPKNDENGEIFDFHSLTIYIEEGIYKFSLDDDLQNKIIKDVTTDHLKYITRKHPKLTKALIMKKYDNFLPEIFSDFFEKLISNKFLFSMDKVFKTLENDIKFNKNKVIDNFYFYNLDKENEGELFKELFIYLTKSDQNELTKFESVYNFLKKIDSSNNIIDIINNGSKESILDLISEREKDHQYRLIFSKKLTKDNGDLFNERSKALLKELTKEGLTANDFHIEFVKKIAKYKDAESLNKGLKTYSESKRMWSKEDYINKIKSAKSKFTEIKEDILLVEISDFKQSSKLGSASWCISSDFSAFNDYTDNFQRQYFIYDFNKEADDPLSMMGVTVDFSGKIINAHDKNDLDLMKSQLINNYEFKALDKESLTNNIIKSKKDIFSIVSDLISYNIDGDVYDTKYKKMVDTFKKTPLEGRFNHFNMITKNCANMSAKDDFIKKFHNDINGEHLFDFKSGIDFILFNPSPFMFNYYNDYIKESKTTEKKTVFTNTFYSMNLTKLYRHEDIGSFDFIFTLVNSSEFKGLQLLSGIEADVYKNNEPLKTKNKSIQNFISILSNEKIYNKIKNESLSFDKIHSLDLCINIYRNGSSKFVSDVDKDLDPKMKKSLIKHLVASGDIETLERIDTKTVYPDNFLTSLESEHKVESLDKFLYAYSDSAYDNNVYQDLFCYAKNKNMVLKDENQDKLLSLNPLLRNRLIEDKLIDNEKYLNIVFKSHLSGQIFVDKKMLENTLNEIEKRSVNIKQPIFESEFLNDFLEHVVYNSLITAKSLQKKLPKTISALPDNLKDWFIEEIEYEKQNKEKTPKNKQV
jgi:hypothetical protein